MKDIVCLRHCTAQDPYIESPPGGQNLSTGMDKSPDTKQQNGATLAGFSNPFATRHDYAVSKCMNIGFNVAMSPHCTTSLNRVAPVGQNLSTGMDYSPDTKQ